MPLRCSARACTASAAFTLVWNNPRLHRPEREKTWLACPKHRDHLADFLGARGFLRRVDDGVPEDTAAGAGDTGDPLPSG